MQPVDAAFEQFKVVAGEVADYLNSIETEADTRLKVLDRILVEVLGWPLAQVSAEPASEGGFADYACSVDGRYRLILEAKRDGRSLGCQGRAPGAFFKLSGTVFREQAAQEGIAQAIRYCGSKNAELACVTNGREWIVFRGTRLGDGLDTRDGMAFVFPTLVAVEDRFSLFHSLLSYDSATRFDYRPYFQEAEGQPIRTSVFHKSLRMAGTARFLPKGQLAGDIDKMMTSFFQRLTGDQDPDLVNLCFVETAESQYANRQLVKMAEDIVSRVQALETGRGDALTTLIERVQETKRHEFVLIVGTKGAGKSTFISRFFSLVLPQKTAADCVVVRVDLRNSPGDVGGVVPWLDAELLQAAEQELFADGPAFAELEGMFFDEYTRLRKGAWAALYESDKVQFRVKFGEMVETMRRERRDEYIQGLLRNVVNSRKKLPVVVFDNADHFDIEFQQSVYQYARSIYERAVCLVILPITDRTSWQLSKHGALQSFEHEALFLPTPATEEIIRKRIEFIEERIRGERERPDDRYFVQRGISLRLDDLTAFTRSLQRVFIQTSDTSRWIGSLANNDVRRTLNLARAFIGSPHLKVEDLIKAHLARSAVEVPGARTAKALIRGHHDIYPAGQHDFVQNVFALNDVPATTPLLGVRLLQMLADVPKREHLGAVVDVDEVVAYFAGMNLDDRSVLLWLDAMLKTGLLLNYDPTVQEIAQAGQVEISPAGRQHLFWASGNWEYLSAMSEATPLLSEDTFLAMRDQQAYRWRERTALFIDYLLREDEMYCTRPSHEAYASQDRVGPAMETIAKQMRALTDRPSTGNRSAGRPTGPRRAR